MTRAMTEKQRRGLEAFEAARAAGMGLSAYARQQGLKVREVHDAVVGLRERGVIPPSARSRRRPSPHRFVAVRLNEGVPAHPVSVFARTAGRALVIRFEIARGRSVQIELADTDQLVAVLQALERAA